MSPLSSKCVLVSTNPGSTVAFDKSMTCTPAGAVAAVVTETIRSPSIKISALTTGASLLPSIKRPARMAILFGAGFSFSCAETGHSAEIKKEIPIAAAATNIGRIIASLAAARIAQAISAGGERERASEKKGPTGLKSGWPRVLWPQPESIWLKGTRCRGTRTTQRPARQVFHSGDAAARQVHNRMIALRHAGDRHFPTLLQHVQTDDGAGDGRKRQRKQRKRRQQLTHEVELQSRQHPQEPPHPFPSVVLIRHPVLLPIPTCKP